MADEHHDEHEDHGNTVAAWFLTLSWIAVWTVAGVAIIGGADLVTWTVVALGASTVCAAVAGVMKKVGLGRKVPRPTPPTAAEWAAARAAVATAPKAADDTAEPAPATAG